MTAHLTNEHLQLYPTVNEENDPPQRIINNIGIPQGATKCTVSVLSYSCIV